ncbi:MAG TPA: AAA family ATPase [Mycobacteriales bacterium]|jgi:DNA-binding CsgD family transcriptional regulator/tetratricopeptide (TPR) repeat protein|nr:AAA family ATPase [Mycobacteriales bacterium]
MGVGVVPGSKHAIDVQRTNWAMTSTVAGENAAPELLGRTDERQSLADLLLRARDGHGGVVVVRGEAGIGKSALLEDLADKAQDCRICRVVGVESEMELAYAGLQQLCAPVIGSLADLPTFHRNALETVFGLIAGSPPDRFLVGMAVLDLMTMVAQGQPLLWLVDDAQWLDRSSMQAIGFASRRLLNDRIVIVIAARDTGDDGDLAGLPEIRLSGLSAVVAGELLDSVVPGPTDPAVRDRIIAETRGNPLALLELPRTWTAAELVEGLAASGSEPLAGHLELAFTKRLSELPPDTQTLLTLAAAEPKGDPALLWSAARQLGLDWNAAGPAEGAGLIEFGPRVYFRHPLVRAAAYRAAPIQVRLEVHRALAEVTDPVRDADRRAWHRASSTVAHDENVAIELEQSAGRARARGGLLAAAALLERAALLTPDGARRANRTLAAAKAKRDAGALDAALSLLSAAESEPPLEPRSALAEQLRGRIAFDQGRGEDAAGFLLSAARRLESLDPTLARDTYLEALAAAIWASGANGRELINKAAEAARAAPPAGAHPRTADLILDALAGRVTDGYEASAQKTTTALAAARSHIIGADDVESLLWLAGNRAAGIMAVESWDSETGRTLAQRQVAVARESGALIQLQFALNFLANNVALTGDIRTAAALVEEERWLSTMTRVAPVGHTSLMLDAFRGDAQRAMPVIRATIENATKDGQGRFVAFAHYVGAVLYNGLGRHADALECARRVLEWDSLGYQTLAAGELAEAASRECDNVLLAEITAWVRARAAVTPTDWALGISARVQALDADAAETADALYRESIECLSRTTLGVELARSHLLYGEWLRRRGQRGAARDQMTIALDAFVEMGIGAFAKRARRELSATTGRRTRSSVDAPSVQLTSQEIQIAQLVQRGLTSREIGGRLFLSARTVEWHLRNIFGKVGVSSRRQLRDASLGLRDDAVEHGGP